MIIKTYHGGKKNYGKGLIAWLGKKGGNLLIITAIGKQFTSDRETLSPKNVDWNWVIECRVNFFFFNMISSGYPEFFHGWRCVQAVSSHRDRRQGSVARSHSYFALGGVCL